LHVGRLGTPLVGSGRRRKSCIALLSARGVTAARRLDLGQCFVGFSEQPHDDACTVGKAEQIAERGLTPVWKLDSRFHPARQHEAREAEALGEGTIVRLVRNALEGRYRTTRPTFWNGKQSSGPGSLSSSTASTSELRYEHGRDS
jgi:hypothetical protein